MGNLLSDSFDVVEFSLMCALDLQDLVGLHVCSCTPSTPWMWELELLWEPPSGNEWSRPQPSLCVWFFHLWLQVSVQAPSASGKRGKGKENLTISPGSHHPPFSPTKYFLLQRVIPWFLGLSFPPNLLTRLPDCIKSVYLRKTNKQSSHQSIKFQSNHVNSERCRF